MGDMALWAFEENHDVEQLGQKLLFTTLELEKLKSEAMEEMRKNDEYVKQLIHLLTYAIKERDEARIQLHKLLNKRMPLTHFQPDHPLKRPGKPNSGITESNSPNSSPVESFIDAAVSSPELSDIDIRVGQPLAHHDQGSLVLDNLVKGRILPQRGKFLQAVVRAGPLLQTLMVSGPLPRWRNPPQVQPFQIPPVSISGCDKAEAFDHKQQPYYSCGPGQVQSAGPGFNFGGLASNASCLNNSSIISSGFSTNGNFVPLAKRQRLS